MSLADYCGNQKRKAQVSIMMKFLGIVVLAVVCTALVHRLVPSISRPVVANFFLTWTMVVFVGFAGIWTKVMG